MNANMPVAASLASATDEHTRQHRIEAGSEHLGIYIAF